MVSRLSDRWFWKGTEVIGYLSPVSSTEIIWKKLDNHMDSYKRGELTGLLLPWRQQRNSPEIEDAENALPY